MKYVASILALFAFSHLPAVSQNQQQERIRIEPKTDVVKRSAPPQNAVLDRLIALDKEASSRVSSLSHLRRSTWRSVSASSKRNAHIQAEYKLSASRLSEGSKQLLALEYHINRDLEDAYIAAASELTVDNRVLLIRLAALHWHSQLRRHLQRSKQALGNQCSAVTHCESGAAEYKNGSCVCRDATMPNGYWDL